MLAGHLPKRGHRAWYLHRRLFYYGCRIVAARRSIEGNPRRHGICLGRQLRSSRFFYGLTKVPNGPRKLRVPANCHTRRRGVDSDRTMSLPLHGITEIVLIKHVQVHPIMLLPFFEIDVGRPKPPARLLRLRSDRQTPENRLAGSWARI